MNASKISIGDIVVKSGADNGKIGIVIKYEINPVHNELITVMLANGTIKVWYAKLVRRI